MLLFVPLFLFFPIKACRATLPPTMRQQSFQRLSANPIMDPVLKSIKFHLYPKRKTQLFFNNKIFLAFTNNSLNEYKDSITLNEWINNRAQLQNNFS